MVIAPFDPCDSKCCGGSACAAAKPEPRECSSGRECIACTFDELSHDRFRVVLSSFAPADPPRKLLEPGSGAALELCVQLGSSEVHCVPAHAQRISLGEDQVRVLMTLP